MINELEPVLVYRSKIRGLDYGQFEKLYLLDDRFEYYMAFSQKTSDEIVNRFKRAFDKIKKGKTFQYIKEKYFK